VIDRLPLGYNTVLGERGLGFQGAKSKACDCAGVAQNPAVLIFDEATSSLDAAAAEALTRTINSLKGKVNDPVHCAQQASGIASRRLLGPWQSRVTRRLGCARGGGVR